MEPEERRPAPATPPEHGPDPSVPTPDPRPATDPAGHAPEPSTPPSTPPSTSPAAAMFDPAAPGPQPSTPADPAAQGQAAGVAVAVEGEQSDAQAQAAAAAEPARLGKRAGRSPRDMAMSLIVLLVPIALLLAFYRVVLSGEAPVTVDAAPAIQQAQSAGAFPVAVPEGLSDDWHVTSANFKRAPEGASLRLGYVAPDDDAVLLIESSVPAAQLLPAELGKEAKPRGTFRDGEAAWRSYLARPGETALVLTDQTRTIIVLGNSDEKNLQALAAAVS
ncbi:DUF4245 domain-containing protein [Actinoplanes sp. NPDC051633]|uniref:DUF4245 domain-containing protein n=1 Tax=Actinoplanes sp. NPDC051633 TaxID=3155670 RepID=UPI0034363422